MKVLNKYNNGNATITILDDGTRITESNDEFLNLDYPLSIDLCITKKCFRNCAFCYNNSNSNGKHADLNNLKFLETMPKGAEIAIGGGSITEHPDLVPFLEHLKDLNLITNITVSQGELIDNMMLINDLIDKELIHGLGVSYKEPQDLIYKNMEQSNMVVHLIAGIHGKETFDYLSQFKIKILILGYKDIGRGWYYKDACNNEIQEKIDWLKERLDSYKDKFEVISFDNLALEQLDIQNKISEEEWRRYFQGNDGDISCYIDAVERTVHKNSLEKEYIPLTNDMKEMFKEVKNI